MTARHRVGMLSALGAGAAVMMMASVAFACTNSSYITSGSTSGPAGSEVMVTAAQFESREGYGPVEIRWNTLNGDLLASAPGPSFSVPVRIPAAPPAVYYINAIQRSTVDGNIAWKASVVYEVTAPATSTPPPSGATTPPPQSPAPSPPTASSPTPAPPAPSSPAPSSPTAASPTAASPTPAPPTASSPAAQSRTASSPSASSPTPSRPTAQSSSPAPSSVPSVSDAARTTAARSGSGNRLRGTGPSAAGVPGDLPSAPAAGTDGSPAVGPAADAVPGTESPAVEDPVEPAPETLAPTTRTSAAQQDSELSSLAASSDSGATAPSFAVGIGLLSVGLITVLASFSVAQVRRRKSLAR